VGWCLAGTLTFDGPLLAGTTVPPTTYQIDLLGFARNAASWTVVTPQFGNAAVTADGGVNASATCHDIPGAAAGTRLEMTGTRLGGRVYSWVGKLLFLTQVGPTVAGAKRIPLRTVLSHDWQAVAAAVARASSKL
jgi:hypothetical protein